MGTVPTITDDDRSAYFGAWRVRIGGCDIRGFWTRADAEFHAAKIRGRMAASVVYTGADIESASSGN